MFDSIVIGGGISGLVTGCLLALEGQQVLLLDKNRVIGGMLQSFQREGINFDSSVHYIGAMGEGETLWTFFKLLGIEARLRLRPLKEEGFDEYIFPSFRFQVPRGVEAFQANLERTFPREKKGIATFIAKMRDLTQRTPLYNPTLPLTRLRDYIEEISLEDYFDDLGFSPELRAVLSATTYLHNVEPKNCPLHVHFLVLDSFLQSAWRIDGGSQHLADVLAARFQELGGRIALRSEVQKILVEGGKAKGIRLKNGQEFQAHQIISSVHPRHFLALLDEEVLKHRYRQRILSRKDGIGAFTLFMGVPAAEDWGHNVYWFDDIDITRAYRQWITPDNWAPTMVFASLAHGALLGFTPMRYENVLEWRGDDQFRRSQAYFQAKREAGQRLKAHLQKIFPDLDLKDRPFWTATPLTYEGYTHSFQGSSFGLKHDMASLRFPLSPQLPIRNLYLTGQSTLLPGVVGSTLSAVLTVSMMLGWEVIERRLKAILN